MTQRSLIASINGQAIGTLYEQDGIWAFQYRPVWLNAAHRFALSPSLPLHAGPLVDGASIRPVQWYFDNLLPEEGQRSLLATDAKLDATDAFGLLAYYGAESAGSVTLLQAAQGEDNAVGVLLPMSDAALSQRIQQLPRVPLTHGAAKRMSLAGAQHKLAIVLRDNTLYEPEGALPSLQILKPDHPDPDYPHSAVNEWFVMTLAGRLGLEVPRVQRRYVPQPVYIVDRFDRVMRSGDWERIHAIDACQLLSLDRSFKYVAADVAKLAELANACRSPAVARTRLFSWLVFNVLAGNGDAHLKNLSFLVSEAGIQLAPYYDLLSTAVYGSPTFDKYEWPEQASLAWPVLHARRFNQLNRAILIQAAQIMGIQRSTAERLLEAQRSRINVAAEELYRDFELEVAKLGQARPELRATLAGESRCLRAIIHVVIRTMIEKLK
jgi:serine/threonine-protein kinase HipA